MNDEKVEHDSNKLSLFCNFVFQDNYVWRQTSFSFLLNHKLNLCVHFFWRQYSVQIYREYIIFSSMTIVKFNYTFILWALKGKFSELTNQHNSNKLQSAIFLFECVFVVRLYKTFINLCWYVFFMKDVQFRYFVFSCLYGLYFYNIVKFNNISLICWSLQTKWDAEKCSIHYN